MAAGAAAFFFLSALSSEPLLLLLSSEDEESLLLLLSALRFWPAALPLAAGAAGAAAAPLPFAPAPAAPAPAAPAAAPPFCAARAARARRLCLAPAAWFTSVSRLVQLTLQTVHFQGGRVDRNSRPVGSAGASEAAVGPPARAAGRPPAANPPGLVAASAYFSCSVTQTLWVCGNAIRRGGEEGRGVSRGGQRGRGWGGPLWLSQKRSEWPAGFADAGALVIIQTSIVLGARLTSGEWKRTWTVALVKY